MVFNNQDAKFSRLKKSMLENGLADKRVKSVAISSKAPATYIKRKMSKQPVDVSLLNGVNIIKVTRKGQFRARVFTISSDHMNLFCTNGKILSETNIKEQDMERLRNKYVRKLDIADVDYVVTGFVCTHKLEISRKTNRLTGKEDKADRNRNEIVSIVHNGGDTLDFFVAGDRERELLVSTVNRLCEAYKTARIHVWDEASLLGYIWYDIDKNQNGLISVKEFIAILKRINLHVQNARNVYESFQNKNGITDSLTYYQCMTLLYQIKNGEHDSRIELAESKLWDDIFGRDTMYITTEEFAKQFLHPVQNEHDASIEDVKDLFQTINKIELNFDETSVPIREGSISRYRFPCYLHGELNRLFDPFKLVFNPESMNEPLSSYWINSSHNTYCMGDQMRSFSSVQMYNEALRRGCKCLELDCWDGETHYKTLKPIPVLYHGMTLTSKILFEDVLYCIKSYLQSYPETYPLILSLENHCSAPYQTEMASLLKNILGDKIYAPYSEEFQEQQGEVERLPSPNQLKGRVLIKGKRSNLDQFVFGEDDEGDSSEDEDGDLNGTNGEEENAEKNLSKADSKNRQQGMKQKRSSDGLRAAKIKIVKELAELTLFHGCSFKAWEHSIALPACHMHSINEHKITKLVKKGGSGDWRNFNCNHMTRNYPAGTRVTSSNYNPILAWSMGCQMVALNFQTNDSPMILNDGRFRQNGSCGYVLKPESACGSGTIVRKNPLSIKIRLVSGSCLPKPEGKSTGEEVDPYVEITLHDVLYDKSKTEIYKSSTQKTPVIVDNGFSPSWNEKDFHEFECFSPDVAMIQLSVHESNGNVAGDFFDFEVSASAIPLAAIREGYRSIPIYALNGSRSGHYGFATLLVEIRITDGIVESTAKTSEIFKSVEEGQETTAEKSTKTVSLAPAKSAPEESSSNADYDSGDANSNKLPTKSLLEEVKETSAAIQWDG
mmetsp:Transcript_19520/g.29370  ORF Transcript_19520/g.29370 Transcript_19520/m.29370 type:complete len:949 (+) Transcript_19520:87-2933(+)